MFYHCRIWIDFESTAAAAPASFDDRFYSDSAFEKTISE